MRQLIDQQRRVFLIDPTRDEKFNDWAPVCPSLERAGELSATRDFRVRVVTEHQAAFETICWLAYVHRRNCLLAVDEIHEFVPSSHLSIPPWFRKCVLRGRHEGISVIGASQRTANIHNDFLFQAAAHRVYVFRTPTEDLGGLKRYKHLHGAAALEVGQFLTWPIEISASGRKRGRPRKEARPAL
jgi:DNA helicase HerA-like ATPase